MQLGDQLYCLKEMNMMSKVDPDTLDYKEQVLLTVFTIILVVFSLECNHLRLVYINWSTLILRFMDQINLMDLVAVNGASAHPHMDKDGTVYNLGRSFGKQCFYKILKIPPAEIGVY